MQRRALLAAISAAFTGCTASPPVSTTTTTSTTTTARTTEPDARIVVTNLAVETETGEQTHRYLVRITKVYSADAVSKEAGTPEVVDVSELENPGVRTLVEDVLTEGKIHRDSLPAGFQETTDRVDFFTWTETTDPEDTALHWAIKVFDAQPGRDPPLQFDAALTDHGVSPDDPAGIAFRIANVGAETQKVFSGTAPRSVFSGPTDPVAGSSCGVTTRTRAVSPSTTTPRCAISARSPRSSQARPSRRRTRSARRTRSGAPSGLETTLSRTR